jgi:hypothetical protein
MSPLRPVSCAVAVQALTNGSPGPGQTERLTKVNRCLTEARQAFVQRMAGIYDGLDVSASCRCSSGSRAALAAPPIWRDSAATFAPASPAARASRGCGQPHALKAHVAAARRARGCVMGGGTEPGAAGSDQHRVGARETAPSTGKRAGSGAADDSAYGTVTRSKGCPHGFAAIPDNDAPWRRLDHHA